MKYFSPGNAFRFKLWTNIKISEQIYSSILYPEYMICQKMTFEETLLTYKPPSLHLFMTFSTHTKIWLLFIFKTPFLFIFFVALKSPRNLSIICHGYKDDNSDKFTTITKIFFYLYSSQVPKMNCGLIAPFLQTFK